MITLPPSLASLTYTDGKSIFKDGTVRGSPLISAIFNTLDADDDLYSHVESLSAYDWPEATQTSTLHDARMLATIQNVVRKSGASGTEIDSFLGVDLLPSFSCP